MHENREIFCTSCPLQQDRSVKAINHNADVNVQEKSDCAVVPVNRPNKEGQPSAEVGEGRAQTEENTVQSRMPPTQSEKRMSPGLDGVRKAASVSEAGTVHRSAPPCDAQFASGQFLRAKAAGCARSGWR